MSLTGHVDVVKRLSTDSEAPYHICGWAADLSLLQDRPVLEVLIDDVVVGDVVGLDYREDLATGKIGDGTYGFHYPVPKSLYDGKSHLIRVRFKTTKLFLPEAHRFEATPDKEMKFELASTAPDPRETPDGLVWSGKAFQLALLPDLDPSTWVGANQRNVLEMPMASVFSTAVWEKAAPILYVCALFMVKNEEDIISSNLCWLYYLGLRRFVIIDNKSTDATRWLIERFRDSQPDVELLIIDDPIMRHIQSEKTTGIMELAASVWSDCRWAIPVDADEFLVAERGLLGLLDVPDEVDSLVVPKCYHMLLQSDDHELQYQRNFFKQMPVRTELHRAPPKILLRLRRNLIISQGNHFVNSVAQAPQPIYSSAAELGIFYREFSIRSFAQFKNKVINGGKAIEAAEKLGLNVGGHHWKSRYAGFVAHGDPWLREKFESEFIQPVSKSFILDEFAISSLIWSIQPYLIG